tara:strand:- start:351 stop:779 length:429 start_codon:yes stop_codon:yes gene_type:complete
MNEVNEPETLLTRSESLARARRIAWLFDETVRLPGGFRVGLDGLLGLIPVVGDLIGLAASLGIVDIARREGVPAGVQVRMLANIGIDAAVGAIPLVGDLFDFGWKANARNVALLERALDLRPPVEASCRSRIPDSTSSGDPT